MTDKFECEFCEKGFVRERTLINHLCPKKRRWFNRDQKHVRLAFNSWLRWYEVTRTTPNKKNRSYRDFMDSKEYISFVKFGRHVENTKLVNPEQFIDFVIKNGYKLKDWTRDSVFEMYSKQICRNEDVQTALNRFVHLIDQWASENQEEWIDYFKKIQPGTALHCIRTGRISPWVLLNATTADKLFERMSDEQRDIVDDFIDIRLWKIKFRKNPNDVDFARDTLGKYGI